MTGVELIDVILSFFPWGFLKLAILILVALYMVFAVVIVRQETLMAKVVEIPFSPVLRVISLSHMIATIVVFVSALLLL